MLLGFLSFGKLYHIKSDCVYFSQVLFGLFSSMYGSKFFSPLLIRSSALSGYCGSEDILLASLLE